MTSKRTNSIRNLLRRLRDDRRGTMAAVMAVAAVPIIGIAGVGVDTARGYMLKQRMSQALDAAALAGARVMYHESRDADIAKFYFANIQPGYLGATLQQPSIQASVDQETLTLTAAATLPSTFTRVLGVEAIPVTAATEVKRASQNVEVSLVLDLTSSMDGQREEDLRAAAKELVDIVVKDQQTPSYSKVALVPYSAAVNAGVYANAVRGTPTAGCNTFGCTQYRFRRYSDNSNVTFNISTCVTEREGANALTDASPAVSPVGKNYTDPGGYNPCQSSPIRPLTSNKADLHAWIDAMNANGSTGGQIGVAWGWYLVSPTFTAGMGAGLPASSTAGSYGDDKLLKAVVIMTDGEYNSIYHNGVIAKNSISGSGANQYKINENSNHGSSYAQSEALCTAMKAQGITVYTVGLDVIDTPAATSLVQNCATSPAHVYLPNDGVELQDAFRAIGKSISTLRLSK
ncbi:pilus assembly protein TadG-related protein [Desertibaculum subflavum]|uniref:pilus assembly protein TadG-related protein n=1 Tax=Desertibaculum subflavum TaxID=2268458 RepID=UPI0013C4B461